MASLEVITGCMFSGKSEELIRRLRRASIADQGVICFSPRIDDRYSDRHAVSHSGHTWESYGINTAQDILLWFESDQAEVVGIEEAQFLGRQLPEVCRLLVGQGRRVICAGLDMDCFARPFDPMPQLLCEADRVEKLSAVCIVCKQEATRSQLLIDEKPAPLMEVAPMIIGASESYQARCRSCHEIPS